MTKEAKIAKIMVLVLCFALILVVGTYLADNICQRHYWVETAECEQAYVAWHIALPGYETRYTPEDEMDLQKWSGTELNGLVATNQDGTVNKEATAGMDLLSTGAFPGYELKKKDNGHYVLYRPEKTERYFTMQAWYRIGPGQRDAELDYCPK